jgi:hypothetical protein
VMLRVVEYGRGKLRRRGVISDLRGLIQDGIGSLIGSRRVSSDRTTR